MEKTIFFIVFLILFGISGCDTSVSQYQVVFRDYDASIILQVTINEGETVTPPENPSRRGFTFDGWDSDFTFVTSNIDIYAQYIINTYTLRFFSEDEVLIDEIDVIFGSHFNPPSPPEKEHHTFVGWSQNINDVSENLDLWPLYQINTYEITFLTENEEVLFQVDVEHGNSVVAPSDPIKEGHIFIGWNQPLDEFVEDTIISPIFEPLVFEIRIFDVNNTITETRSMTYGAIIETLNDYEPNTPHGYLWFKNNDVKPVEFPLKVTENSDLKMEQYTLNLLYEPHQLDGAEGWKVAQGTTTDRIIKIPSFYQGLPVIYIDREGFKDSLITEVTIPHTIIRIGTRAFEDAALLQMINFSEQGSLRSIALDAFAKTPSLSSVQLPEGLERLEQGVFYLSDNLKEITIPASLNYLGPYTLTHAFNLEKIEIAEDNPYFVSIMGVVYTKDLTQLIVYPSAKEALEYSVLSTTQRIRGHAFDNTQLLRLNLTSNIESIESFAIAGGSIESVVFRNGISPLINVHRDAFVYRPLNFAIYVPDVLHETYLNTQIYERFNENLEIKPLSQRSTDMTSP